MATINSTAASNFFNHITQQYDKLCPKQSRHDLITADSDGDEAEDLPEPEDPFLQQTQEYNQTSDMTSWYQAFDAITPLTQNHFHPVLRTQSDLEITALHYSALEHLKVLNEESTYIIPSIAENYPPIRSLISISNPKSELDSWIFRKAYCAVSDAERDQIIELMQKACVNLDPNFFNTDHLIYRIQGVVAFVLSNSMVRQVMCGIVIIAPIVLVFYVTHRIYTAFINALTPQWETIVKQNPDDRLISGLNVGYHKLKDFNDFTTKTALRSQASSYVLPKIIGLSASISSYFPPVLTTAYWIVYPKTGFNWCANKFITSYLLKPSLVAFKIFNGTEYQTVQALKERFKSNPVHCEKAMKAYALWMHLQRKGTPEDTLTLMGYLPAPAA